MTEASQPVPQLERQLKPGQTPSQHMADLRLRPQFRNAFLAYTLGQTILGDTRPDPADLMAAAEREAAKAADGDKTLASDILTAQALSLDALFTDFAHRALLNRADYPDAFNRYMALALKAQSSCRTTLEALAKLHQPREQVVRHVHVYEGGQAVVAEEFHHHTGGRNAGSVEQAHAAARAGDAGMRAALPSPNPIGQPVPSASGTREAAMPHARRSGRKRRAEG